MDPSFRSPAAARLADPTAAHVNTRYRMPGLTGSITAGEIGQMYATNEALALVASSGDATQAPAGVPLPKLSDTMATTSHLLIDQWAQSIRPLLISVRPDKRGAVAFAGLSHNVASEVLDQAKSNDALLPEDSLPAGCTVAQLVALIKQCYPSEDATESAQESHRRNVCLSKSQWPTYCTKFRASVRTCAEVANKGEAELRLDVLDNIRWAPAIYKGLRSKPAKLRGMTWKQVIARVNSELSLAESNVVATKRLHSMRAYSVAQSRISDVSLHQMAEADALGVTELGADPFAWPTESSLNPFKSQEEGGSRAQRFKDKLCLFCAGSDHVLAQCPDLAQHKSERKPFCVKCIKCTHNTEDCLGQAKTRGEPPAKRRREETNVHYVETSPQAVVLAYAKENGWEALANLTEHMRPPTAPALPAQAPE